MLLSEEQIELLKNDLDYMLGRTACNTVQPAKFHIINALARDPDILLDLVAGMSPDDARWLSVPIDILQPLINRRSRGTPSKSNGGDENLMIAF